MKILAIESSCDETSVSVIDNEKVISNIISSQIFHTRFGGVVPELASRAHIKLISLITRTALDDSKSDLSEMNAIAVTTMPGLIGSLIVGSNFAKGLSIKYDLPLIPINHIEGHLYSGCLEDATLEFPFITLVVSGGHTALFHVESYNDYSIMGLTKDDAAGEAFDKIAKMLGFPYPGGPHIDRLAQTGNPKRFDFPRSMLKSGDYNFSFSGLKTSVRYFLAKNYPDGIPESDLSDISASVQTAIVDVLVSKTVSLAKEKKVKSIVIAGGVSANSQLRRDMKATTVKNGIRSIAPSMNYCMDNAAMIGFLASKKLANCDLDGFYNYKFTVNPTALRAKR